MLDANTGGTALDNQTMIKKAPRRHDLDALRVLAILAVFVFHSGRFFDLGDWHVKNPTTYFGVQVWTEFLANWLMPVIFVISGASLFYALGTRGAGQFAMDKVRRLLIPLLVGVFTHAALMVYLERITHHQFAGSFLDFIPHYFDGWYGFGGNFAWMGLHLWYLCILFIYSLLLYPLFRWLSGGFGQAVLKRLGDLIALPGAVYLLALPVAWVAGTLDPGSVLGMRDFGGWALPVYLLFFLYGFIVISHDGLQKRIEQFRWASLAIGGAGLLLFYVLMTSDGDPAFGSDRFFQAFAVYGASSWCWILAFLGFGCKHLTSTTRILEYANPAVLPFYIMHQTVLLCIGYFVTQWPIPDALKAIVISATAFSLILATYEYVIRRSNVLRFLFGMKPLRKAEATPPVAQM
jgi:glucans biosynthesis protein C